MTGIPPAIETDSEDVAWALQTADALWKRDERVDAIVWLRRAAQAAGDAEDDDRALVLARNAAELADWMGRDASPGPKSDPRAVAVAPRDSNDHAGPSSSRAHGVARPSSGTHGAARPSSGAHGAAPDIRRSDDEATSPDVTLPPPSTGLRPPPLARPSAVAAPAALPPIVPTPRPGRGTHPPPAPSLPIARVPGEDSGPSAVEGGHVLTAAEVHAGMLDPWAEGDPPARARDLAESPDRSGNRLPGERDPDDVVTSAPPVSQPRPGRASMNPSLPPPPTLAAAPAHAARWTPPPSSAVGRVDELGIPLDWPDAARRLLDRAVAVRELARDEEVSGFGLVSVLAGEVDIAATIVDAPAERLRAGSMVRGRGTIDAMVPLRAVGADDGTRVATWTEKQVAQAMSFCPEVEEALRTAGNRIQALVGATMGPLGERLDASLRAEVTSRLRLRVVAEHEVVATAGRPIPGLLVVGSGELEFLGRSGLPEGAVLRSGDFLFPSEVLRAAAAPRSARAAKGGALVLMADRAGAQELLVTFPLLLEIFAEA